VALWPSLIHTGTGNSAEQEERSIVEKREFWVWGRKRMLEPPKKKHGCKGQEHRRGKKPTTQPFTMP